MTTQFTITKRIAKHSNQSMIIIPKLIEEHLKPETIVELKIEIIENTELATTAPNPLDSI